MDKTGTTVAAKQLRSFGLLVGGIFLVIGLWPLVFRGEPFRVWACVLACVLILPALVWPRSLGPIYRGWMAIGAVLGWINTRIILSLIFYVIFTPIGFFPTGHPQTGRPTAHFRPRCTNLPRRPRTSAELAPAAAVLTVLM